MNLLCLSFLGFKGKQSNYSPQITIHKSKFLTNEQTGTQYQRFTTTQSKPNQSLLIQTNEENSLSTFVWSESSFPDSLIEAKTVLHLYFLEPKLLDTKRRLVEENLKDWHPKYEVDIVILELKNLSLLYFL